jgi:sortase A
MFNSFLISKASKKTVKSCLLVIIFTASAINFGQVVWIDTKAYLAQYLIEMAWKKTLETQGEVHKPWSWSDTWPIARLRAPRLEVDWIVLEGISGQALAFGPGGVMASQAQHFPEYSNGNFYSANTTLSPTRVIAGHKDTHFAFLESLKLADIIEIQTKDGKWHEYTVANLEITEPKEHKIAINNTINELTLITCYPFGYSITPSQLRFIVTLEKITNHA